MHKKLYTLLKISLLGLFFTLIFTYSKPAMANQPENKIYRFGVITLTHPIVLYRQYIPFFDYLNEHLPWSFELVLYKEYKDVVQAIEKGSIDMALLGGSTFVQAQRRTNLQPIVAVLASNGTTQTYSIFMAKSDNNKINTLDDVHGKSIAFGPVQSTSSFIIPIQFLANNSITLDGFSAYTNLNNHDAVARAILRGEYEVGVMGESFAQRFLNQGLKKIAVTEPFPGFLLVAREGVPQDVRQALKNFLLSINPQTAEFNKKSSSWPEILRHGFAPVVMSDYKIFEKLSDISK